MNVFEWEHNTGMQYLNAWSIFIHSCMFDEPEGVLSRAKKYIELFDTWLYKPVSTLFVKFNKSNLKKQILFNKLLSLDRIQFN